MERRIDTGTQVADHVMKLLDAAKITNAVVQACELQLFDEVEKTTGSATTAAKLAKNKNWEPDALRRLMDTMVSVKLLSKTQQNNGQDTYQNTEGGRLLIKDGPPAMHEYAMSVNDDNTSISGLAETIKKGPLPDGTGGEQNDEEGYGGTYPPEFWLNIYRMCDGIAQPYADQVMTAFDLSKHKKVVDLGGGSGVFSYALLRAYPEMEVIIGELPVAVPVIEEHFISKNKDPRISTLAVDYKTDTIPKADLYVLGNVIHDHEPDKCKELLTKVHGALNTGGAILIVDQLINDARDGPPLAHAWDLSFLGMARFYTGKELGAILNECNFGNVQIVKTQECCTSDIVYAFKK